MSNIQNRIEADNGSKAFIPYITAGYPDKATSIALGIAAAENGADVLELGIPFSDPLADGAVIQASFQTALENGIDLEACFAVAEGIKKEADIPIVFMMAYNLIYQQGIENFAERCQGVVDGLIIPDLPPEAASKERGIFNEAGIDIIFLIAPNTPHERRKRILEYSSGYLYCLSRLGITGVQADVADGLGDYLDELRKETDLPLIVGFGISKPEHVAGVCAYADGAIVGSAIVKIVTECIEDKEAMLSKVGAYIKEMKAAAAV